MNSEAFAANSASAGLYSDGLWGGRGGFQLYRASQPSQNPSRATSRPSNRNMRGIPSMGDRRMRGGMGGGTINGGMGRR
jgi:hypothetical protein